MLRDLVVAFASSSKFALTERRALLRLSARNLYEIELVGPASFKTLLSTDPALAIVILDVNQITLLAVTLLSSHRRRYILDVGDDARSLAIGMGRSRSIAYARGSAQLWMLRTASHVVVRGRFHRPLVLASGSVTWLPDTVPDFVLDRTWPEGDQNTVSTFGSIGKPAHGDRAYGWEVVDLVATDPSLRGRIVGHGPGLRILRERARRMSVSDRIDFLGAMPLPSLLEMITMGAWTTSVQSDDRAGWVRTTGKLPLILGCGRTPLSTAVGEAQAVLPNCLMSSAQGDVGLIEDFLRVINAGPPDNWAVTGRQLAELYRRSSVGHRYVDVIESTYG